MIHKVKIYSRLQMNHFAESQGKRYPYFPFLNEQWGLISIYTSGRYEYLTPETRNTLNDMGCKHMLSLSFWDITDNTDMTGLRKEARLFDDDQAKQCVDMVKEMHESEQPFVFIAHCDAGVSRSGAMGEFVTDYCGMDYLRYRSENNVHPNKYVLRKLRENSSFYPPNYKR